MKLHHRAPSARIRPFTKYTKAITFTTIESKSFVEDVDIGILVMGETMAFALPSFLVFPLLLSFMINKICFFLLFGKFWIVVFFLFHVFLFNFFVHIDTCFGKIGTKWTSSLNVVTLKFRLPMLDI